MEYDRYRVVKVKDSNPEVFWIIWHAYSRDGKLSNVNFEGGKILRHARIRQAIRELPGMRE
jgi:hypothetical protein